MLTLLYIAVCSTMVREARSYTTFNTNCSLPNNTVNYVASPNTRGSLDIIWSALATLIACTYTALHLNLPLDNKDPTKLRRKLQRWIPLNRSILFCMAVVLVPEFSYGVAFEDWYSARKELKLHKESKKTDTSHDWLTMTHMFYANMGGFVLQYREEHDESSNDEKRSVCIPKPLGTQGSRTSAPVPNPGEISAGAPIDANNAILLTTPVQSLDISSQTLSTCVPMDGDETPISTFTSDRLGKFHLRATVLRVALESGFLENIDIPSATEIMDRSKSDWFAKLLIILQIVSFSVTVIARAAEGISISPLEIAVSAYSLGSVFTFACQLSKPKDVETTITLATFRRIPKRILRLQARYTEGKAVKACAEQMSATQYNELLRPTEVEKKWHMIMPASQSEKLNMATNAIICGTGICFGAIHLTAWHLYFPSVADRWLWRSSAILTTAGPAILAASLGIVVHINTHKANMNLVPIYSGYSVFGTLFVAVVIAYPIARLILMVEVIRTLFFLPVGAFMTPSWTIDIPHIG